MDVKFAAAASARLNGMHKQLLRACMTGRTAATRAQRAGAFAEPGLSRTLRPLLLTRSMRSDTAFITTAFLLTALTTTVSAFPVFAPQGTHHAPKAAAPLPLAPPSRPHMPTHIRPG